MLCVTWVFDSLDILTPDGYLSVVYVRFLRYRPPMELDVWRCHHRRDGLWLFGMTYHRHQELFGQLERTKGVCGVSHPTKERLGRDGCGRLPAQSFLVWSDARPDASCHLHCIRSLPICGRSPLWDGAGRESEPDGSTSFRVGQPGFARFVCGSVRWVRGDTELCVFRVKH